MLHSANPNRLFPRKGRELILSSDQVDIFLLSGSNQLHRAEVDGGFVGLFEVAEPCRNTDPVAGQVRH